MSSNVEQVKARLSVVDVVGSYVKLTRAGANWKACCPFHQEKTPSFYVSPTRESWHCFGCDKGGDIFSFVEEYEGLDFLSTLKLLAERAGVPLVFDGRSRRDGQEEGKNAMELATCYYEELLRRKSDVNDYLESRGLSPSTISRFRLGYAPMGWRHMTDALLRRGVKAEALERTGLSIKSLKTKGDLYDRFRGRIMFPLRDPSGAVIGFSGRLSPGNTADVKMGKYINTPETPHFSKSRFLYGFDAAKHAIRKARQAVIVEGQMDLLLSHQAGVENVVAVSGTALTENHLILLGRLAEEIVVVFDADTAGMKAAARAFELALRRGLTVRAVLLPEGMDPADYARQNPEGWKRDIASAEHLITFLLKAVAARKIDSEEKRRAIEEEVLPFVAVIKSAIEQAQFVRVIAEELAVPESAVFLEVERRARSGNKTEAAKTERTEKSALNKTERRSEQLRGRLAGIIAWQETLKEPVIPISETKARFLELFPETKEVTTDRGKDIFAAELAYGNGTMPLRELIDDMFLLAEEEAINERMMGLIARMKKSEDGGNVGEFPPENLEQEYHELLKRKAAVKERQRVI